MSGGSELQLTIKGLDLSYEYYREIGRPVLEELFPQYMDKIAAGLVGEGSECFGYDDRISMDHDYGPAFCIWLSDEDYVKIGKEMMAAYEKLPKEFKGIGTQMQRVQAQGRRGVLPIHQFYNKFLGAKGVPEELIDWLVIPEYCLATATNGKVFEDNLGVFTEIRKKLLDYYPEDVRLKKIAARAVTMAHSGQCNYSRMMRRNGTVAAFLALEEFVRATVSMIYLLNKKYTPYYKWMWNGLENMERLASVQKLLQMLVETGLDKGKWPVENWKKFQNKLNMDDQIIMLVEEICALVAMELKAQGISNCSSDYLEEHAYAVMSCIQDSRVRSLPILAF